MRVLLVIDSFGSGGAQRQMVELACGLEQRGHAVEMFVYFPEHDTFRARVEAHGIAVHEIVKRGRIDPRVVTALARLMRQGRFDVVVSYLKNVNVYAELASFLAPAPRLVVSERTSYHDDRSRVAALLRRLLHARADHVVTNSVTQRDYLCTKRWLRHKVSCIYNGLDLGAFAPGHAGERPHSPLRLLGVGRIGPEKNLLTLIEALDLCERELGCAPLVSWAGSRSTSTDGVAYCERIDALLARRPSVAARWTWLGAREDVAGLMREHDALIHPSLYEGLPNVVCEALASGLPVLASDVCDHPALVGGSERGYLFAPDAPGAIAEAIAAMAALERDAWRAMSRRARDYAVGHLGAARMVGAYEALFASLTGDGKAARSGHGN